MTIWNYILLAILTIIICFSLGTIFYLTTEILYRQYHVQVCTSGNTLPRTWENYNSRAMTIEVALENVQRLIQRKHYTSDQVSIVRQSAIYFICRYFNKYSSKYSSKYKVQVLIGKRWHRYGKSQTLDKCLKVAKEMHTWCPYPIRVKKRWSFWNSPTIPGGFA